MRRRERERKTNKKQQVINVKKARERGLQNIITITRDSLKMRVKEACDGFWKHVKKMEMVFIVFTMFS
jgi:hypothetical protein